MKRLSITETSLYRPNHWNDMEQKICLVYDDIELLLLAVLMVIVCGDVT